MFVRRGSSDNEEHVWSFISCLFLEFVLLLILWYLPARMLGVAAV